MVDDELRYDDDLSTVDWAGYIADLTADRFHNGRTAEEMRSSYEASYAVVFARDDGRIVGSARLLSDGVCNAYLVDVWTMTGYRRVGVGSAMVRWLLDRVPGQHVALFTEHQESFYRSLGFAPEEVGMSTIVGTWLRR
jgi:GNAT superfamily N-acetyltransferase